MSAVHRTAALAGVLLGVTSCTSWLPGTTPAPPVSDDGGGPGGAGVAPACPVVVPESSGCVDFGDIELHQVRAQTVKVRNPGQQPLEICPRVVDPAFFVTPGPVRLAPGGEADLTLRFFPLETGLHEGHVQLTTCSPCSPPASELCVRGRAAFEDFKVEDVYFYSVPLGTTRCADVVLRNTGLLPVVPRDVSLSPDLRSGAFTLDVGNVLDGEALPAGASARMPLCFTPQLAGTGYLGQVVVSTRRMERTGWVSGQGDACLRIDPPSLDLGVTVPWIPASATLTVTDGCGNDRVDVTGVSVTDPTLTTTHESLPWRLDRGAFPVDVRFQPGAADTLQAMVQVTLHSVGGSEQELAVPATARVLQGDPCDLGISHERIELQVGPGEEGVQELVLHERSGTCWLWGFELAPDGDLGFAIVNPVTAPVVLGPDEYRVVRVHYGGGEAASSELRLHRMVAPGEDPLLVVPIVNTPP